MLKDPWDRLLQRQPFSEAYTPEEQAKRLLAALSALPAPRLLDLGCGSGRHARWLAEQGARIVALDSSHVGLRLTRRASAHVRCRVSLTRATFEALPFADRVFDGVLAYCSLSHGLATTCGRSIAELVRVLRPGGVAVIYVLSDRDFRLGCGARLEDRTYIFSEGPETGIPHHFFPVHEICDRLLGTETVDWKLDLETAYPHHPHFQSCARASSDPQFAYHDVTIRRSTTGGAEGPQCE
ncbi:MAG: methyltransferase domain-containing protein [Thermoanaerobaculia bacterium]|nr:methyltransferase domain-containing protein [Thermoanaerobaculia bacterium]